MDGTISLGTLIAFQALMGGFLAPVSLLVGLGGTIQSMAGNLNRVDDILNSRRHRSSRSHFRRRVPSGE